jgi:excisionase family DNA binding protein
VIDFAALLAEPTRVAEIPLDGIPRLLLEAQAAHGEVAAVEQALLARLRNGEPAVDPMPGCALDRRRRGQVTVAEFARLAGVRPGTVYDWIHAGRLTVKKLGATKQARVRIPLAELRRIERVQRPRDADGQGSNL